MKTKTDNMIVDELTRAIMPEGLLCDSSNEEPIITKQSKTNSKNSILLEIITDLTRTKTIWQVIAICFVVFFILACFTSFNLYKNNQALVKNIAELKPLETKLAEAKTEADVYKANISKSESEAKQAQDELNNSKVALKKAQDQLADVTNQLQDMQNRNAEVRKMLSGRLQKLSNQSELRR